MAGHGGSLPDRDRHVDGCLASWLANRVRGNAGEGSLDGKGCTAIADWLLDGSLFGSPECVA